MKGMTCPVCGSKDCPCHVPVDHPSRCECGGRGCDCPCHVHTRDNTTSDDDLELDRLKHEAAEYREKHTADVDALNAQLDAANARGAALVVERDALLAENMALEHDVKDLRGQLDDVCRLLEADLTAQDLDLSRQIHAMRDERDEWRDKARVLSAQVLDVLKRLGVTP